MVEQLLASDSPDKFEIDRGSRGDDIGRDDRVIPDPIPSQQERQRAGRGWPTRCFWWRCFCLSSPGSPGPSPQPVLANELIGIEVLHRHLFADDALLCIEVLQIGKTCFIHRAKGLLSGIDILVIELEDVGDVFQLFGILLYMPDINLRCRFGVDHDVFHALECGPDQAAR